MYRVTIVSIVQIELNSNAQLPFLTSFRGANGAYRGDVRDVESPTHGRKGLILFVILSGATAQPKNLAVGAFNIIIYASLDSSQARNDV